MRQDGAFATTNNWEYTIAIPATSEFINTAYVRDTPFKLQLKPVKLSTSAVFHFSPGHNWDIPFKKDTIASVLDKGYNNFLISSRF
jgi:hypothetical protein